jgi:hypothetical protein
LIGRIVLRLGEETVRLLYIDLVLASIEISRSIDVADRPDRLHAEQGNPKEAARALRR